MPDVCFKDLCIDATDDGVSPRRVAQFWSGALNQPLVERADGKFVLDPPPGGPAERRIWINAVPERAGVKSRVHLDLHLPLAHVEVLLGAGASLLRNPTEDEPWHVLADPDGVPLCVMGPHPDHPDAPFGPFELVVDSGDPSAQAQWWADRTGGAVHHDPGVPWAWVTGGAGFPLLFWVFTPVPEPKTVKNRVHWDVTLADAGVDELVRTGSTMLRSPGGTRDWWVLADPEGNEFCAFEPRN